MSEDFEIQEILRKTVGERSYAEFLRVPAMSAGIYRGARHTRRSSRRSPLLRHRTGISAAGCLRARREQLRSRKGDS